jgi:hypothetical protein
MPEADVALGGGWNLPVFVAPTRSTRFVRENSKTAVKVVKKEK